MYFWKLNVTFPTITNYSVCIWIQNVAKKIITDCRTYLWCQMTRWTICTKPWCNYFSRVFLSSSQSTNKIFFNSQKSEQNVYLDLEFRCPWYEKEFTALAGVLSGLRAGLWSKWSPVWFPVRAHAWVAGQVPRRGHGRGNHTLMFLSISFSLPSPLSKKIKYLKKKRKGIHWHSRAAWISQHYFHI